MVAKTARILAIIVVSIILINIVLFITFSIPKVQKGVANLALEKIRPIIGTRIDLEGIRIRLFNTVELDGVYVEDLQQDTLLYINKIAVRINALDLLQNKVVVKKAGIENFTANVYRQSAEEPFNFQFIIDAFSKDKDSTKVDKEKKQWRIIANDLVLKNGNLRYNILSIPATPGQFNVSHIDVTDFNFRGKLNFLSIKDLQAEVNHLNLLEKNAGLALNNLKTELKGRGTKLQTDGVSIHLNGSSIRVKDAMFDTQSKEFLVEVESDQVDPRDINIFVPRFNHLNKPISFNLSAEGELPKAVVKNLNFSYGADLQINLSASIDDFKDFNNSPLSVDLANLSVSQEDLQDMIRIGAPSYVSPDQLLAMGDLDLKMKVNGRLSQFQYNGDVGTDQGDVTVKGTGRIGNKFSSLIFEGPVTARNIKVANIIGESVGVGNSTLLANTKLTILKGSPVSVAANGQIESTSYKGYNYNNIHFDGLYKGTNIVAEIRSEEEQNNFQLSGDITFGETMAFDIKGNVDRLDIKPFISIENWKEPYLKASIDGNLSGNSIDDLAGSVVLDNIILADSNFYYSPGAIYLQATANEGEDKKIEFMSSFFEGNITGDYYFSTIGAELINSLRPHLPSLFVEKVDLKEDHRQKSGSKSSTQKKSQKKKKKRSPQPMEQFDASTESLQQSEKGKNNFQFTIRLQNTEDLSYAFSLPFYNVEPAVISGSVNMTANESLGVDIHLPRLMFGSNDVRETKVNLHNNSSGLDLNVNSYLVQDAGYINVKLNSDAISNAVTNVISFDIQRNNAFSNGEIKILMDLLRNRDGELAANIGIPPATILFNNKQIDINNTTITYEKDRIGINNFGINEDNKLLLGIDGVASKSEADNIRVYFNNTELANILNAFNVTNFAGSIKGDIYVRQAFENPMIRTEELRVEDITVYGDTIGTLRIEGDWDNFLSGLNLKAWLENNGARSLDIKGYIPTGESSPFPMDVNLNIADFKLKAISPLTSGIFSELNGQLNSNIRVTGTLSEPITEGWLGIDDGMMKVAYTNVTYYVSDTIEISRDNVGLRDLVIRDQNNHTATLNVSLSHSNFGRMAYNAGIRLNDFMLLNNEERTDMMAYGNLKLSGELNVTGSSSGIFGKGNLTSSSRSNVTVVIPQTASATEYSGIIYVSSKPKESDSLAFLHKTNESGVSRGSNVSKGIPIVMAVTLNLNQLLEAGVVIDPVTGDALKVSGDGELNLNFNSRSTPPVMVYGDYVIKEGDFHYDIQNLRTIQFNIREGSKLTMGGNPLNSQFDITAYLPVRADLSVLSQTFAEELANTRVPVNALLQIKGNLQAMDLQYDIELPETSADIQQRVKSFVNNEETKILQFAYLVTTGSFIPLEGSPDMSTSSSMFTKFAAGRLSKGLDALFASALNDNWSISTNLESVDGTFDNVRMGVDVSTRLMDDRLFISTNLSYGDNSLMAGKQAFLGEFEIKYYLTNWLMLRAFNRANEKFYRPTPTTQGAGVMVTREGERFRDLFDLRFVRKKEEDDK